jgi:hypothetical protein
VPAVNISKKSRIFQMTQGIHGMKVAPHDFPAKGVGQPNGKIFWEKPPA